MLTMSNSNPWNVSVVDGPTHFAGAVGTSLYNYIMTTLCANELNCMYTYV